MNPTVYRLSSAAAAAVMLVGLIASIVIGGCDELIPTDSGGMPMRCHWTFLAAAAVFAAGTLAALAQLLPVFATSRPARLFAALTTVLLALIAAWLPSPWGIGICAAPGMGMAHCGEGGMDCHLSAPIVWVCAALLVVIAVVQLVMARPDAKKLPRIDDFRA
ncbi:MAG: DUF4418 family protein [Coriobacteriales bacterium]|jgi:hypothetical protein|nr:DUF4418 family protein [Coriobacteriales bacterium]